MEESRHARIKEYLTIEEDIANNQRKNDAIKKYNLNCSR